MGKNLRRGAAAVAVVGLVVVGAPGPARACSPWGTAPLVLDPAYADDTVAPTLAVTSWSVWRGDGSCEGTGAIEFTLARADDRAPAAQLGTELTLISGTWPGPAMPEGPRVQPLNPELSLYFNDRGQDIDVELELRAVDLNGNRSAPVTVRITDDVGSGGCAAGGGGGAGGAALLGLAAIGARRRRAR
ncbi:MAG: hypothetical protein IPL61_30550 [Myxococcales bacterium]|nr:hypothetical protein [Myxococcales bacterium]